MKNGLYRYDDTRFGDRGEIVLRVKETPKAYCFELVKNTMRFSPPHIDMMFAKSSKTKVNKEKSPHAINIEDGWFCLYPYRAGIPYVFEYLNDERSNNGKN